LWKQFRPSQASFPITEVVFQKALEVGLIEKQLKCRSTHMTDAFVEIIAQKEA
jgi:hypothetical protein